MRASGKRSILAAEDNPNDVFLLKSAFEQTAADVTLTLFEHGEEVIKFLALHHHQGSVPELLLLDLNIPRMDGFKVLGWIRKQPDLKQMPVVIFSSSGAAADIDRAYEMGANSYLIKPFEFGRLTKMVHKIVDYWLEMNTSPSCAMQSSARD
jgi:CheY-like chemotaxis protein